MQNDREKEARDAAEAERDAANKVLDCLKTDYDTVVGENDALRAERDGYKTALEDLLKNADRVHPHGEHYVITKAVIDRAVAVKQQALSTNKDRAGG